MCTETKTFQFLDGNTLLGFAIYYIVNIRNAHWPCMWDWIKLNFASTENLFNNNNSYILHIWTMRCLHNYHGNIMHKYSVWECARAYWYCKVRTNVRINATVRHNERQKHQHQLFVLFSRLCCCCLCRIESHLSVLWCIKSFSFV